MASVQEITKTLGMPGTSGGLVTDQLASTIRSVVFSIGGVMIGKGWLTDSDLELYGGIAVNLLLILYLFYRNYVMKNRLVAAAQVNTELSEVQITKQLNEKQIVIPDQPTKKGTSQ